MSQSGRSNRTRRRKVAARLLRPQPARRLSGIGCEHGPDNLWDDRPTQAPIRTDVGQEAAQIRTRGQDPDAAAPLVHHEERLKLA